MARYPLLCEQFRQEVITDFPFLADRLVVFYHDGSPSVLEELSRVSVRQLGSASPFQTYINDLCAHERALLREDPLSIFLRPDFLVNQRQSSFYSLFSMDLENEQTRFFHLLGFVPCSETHHGFFQKISGVNSPSVRICIPPDRSEKKPLWHSFFRKKPSGFVNEFQFHHELGHILEYEIHLQKYPTLEQLKHRSQMRSESVADSFAAFMLRKKYGDRTLPFLRLVSDARLLRSFLLKGGEYFTVPAIDKILTIDGKDLENKSAPDIFAFTQKILKDPEIRSTVRLIEKAEENGAVVACLSRLYGSRLHSVVKTYFAREEDRDTIFHEANKKTIDPLRLFRSLEIFLLKP